MKNQHDKKYYAECERRKAVLESKGHVYWGDLAPMVEDQPIETERVCRGKLCLAANPDGIRKCIESFPWKTQKHDARRSVCQPCKNEVLRMYRENKSKRKRSAEEKDDEHPRKK